MAIESVLNKPTRDDEYQAVVLASEMVDREANLLLFYADVGRNGDDGVLSKSFGQCRLR
jgi:hypothetical protein